MVSSLAGAVEAKDDGAGCTPGNKDCDASLEEKIARVTPSAAKYVPQKPDEPDSSIEKEKAKAKELEKEAKKQVKQLKDWYGLKKRFKLLHSQSA